jgi:hypothetical protein
LSVEQIIYVDLFPKVAHERATAIVCANYDWQAGMVLTNSILSIQFAY